MQNVIRGAIKTIKLHELVLAVLHTAYKQIIYYNSLTQIKKTEIA